MTTGPWWQLCLLLALCLSVLGLLAAASDGCDGCLREATFLSTWVLQLPAGEWGLTDIAGRSAKPVKEMTLLHLHLSGNHNEGLRKDYRRLTAASPLFYSQLCVIVLPASLLWLIICTSLSPVGKAALPSTAVLQTHRNAGPLRLGRTCLCASPGEPLVLLLVPAVRPLSQMPHCCSWHASGTCVQTVLRLAASAVVTISADVTSPPALFWKQNIGLVPCGLGGCSSTSRWMYGCLAGCVGIGKTMWKTFLYLPIRKNSIDY